MRKLEGRKGKAMIEEESELECTKSANYVKGGGENGSSLLFLRIRFGVSFWFSAFHRSSSKQYVSPAYPGRHFCRDSKSGDELFPNQFLRMRRMDHL